MSVRLLSPFVVLLAAVAFGGRDEAPAGTAPVLPKGLAPAVSDGLERLVAAGVTDGEITEVEHGRGGLRVAFVLRPTPKSFIRCELGLADPAKWDGRFWGLGNGGWAGHVSCTRDGVSAYASTDLGTSQYPDRTVTDVPREVLTDYAWRATHLMTVEAKKLVTAYYGRKPDRCYFRGASCGGRQGIVEAYRFPADYDGIMSEVPGFTEHSRASHAWVRDRLKDKYRKWFTKEEIAAVREAELSYFEKTDPWWAHGRFILDPYPTKEKLDGCWAEIVRRVPALADREEMWRKLFDPVTVNGKPYAPGRLIGIEFDSAWTFLLPKYSGKKRAILNTEDDLARFAAEPDLRIGHDFSAFKSRGGKLIMYGGLEDLSCPEPEMREFYEAVLKEMGGIGEVSKFFAYYAVPGRSHGAKGEPFGPGQVGWPTQKERNDKLVNWVEKGARPGALNFIWAHETAKTLSITPYPESKLTYSDAAPYAASRPDYLVFTPRQRNGDAADPKVRGDSYNDHFQVIWDGKRRLYYAFWTQGTGEGKDDMHIVFSKSADRGATWTYPVVLAGSEFAADPKPRAVWQQPMLSKSGRLYCLWNQQVTDDRLHHGEMRGIFSDDAGVTWCAPQKVEMKAQLRDKPGKPPSWCNWQRPLRLGKDGRFFVGCTRRGTDPQEGHTSTKIEFWEFENIDEDPEPKDIRIGYYATGKDSLAVEIGNINRYLAEEAGIVKLPDGRLFALVRTRARHPFWSQSRDGGRTWSALKPLVGLDGKPFLHPCSPCPIYDWKGCEAGSGTYFAFIHNTYDDSIEPLGKQRRGPLYLIAGTFDPDGEQPIRFSAPKLFSPVKNGNSYYASYTVADGEGVLWFAHQKHWLLGRKIGPEWFK